MRFLIALFCVLSLAACDSGEDPPGSDLPLFSVVVDTPSGESLRGLTLTMEYDLVSATGDRRPPAVLRYFEVEGLGDDRFRAEWETESEDNVERFVLEAGGDEDTLGDVAEVEPQGPDVPYALEVEGRYGVFRLRIEDADGSVDYSDLVVVAVSEEDDPPAFPEGVRLGPNYPNPFSTATNFRMELSSPRDVTLDVLDLEGDVVARVYDEPLQGAGSYQVEWTPGEAFVGGFYRARLVAGEDTATVLMAYTGTEATDPADQRRIRTTLGQTDTEGRFVTDERGHFPQLYDGLEAEFRGPNNEALGLLRPSDTITLVLRDSEGREQRYERTLVGETNRFKLTWDPE